MDLNKIIDDMRNINARFAVMTIGKTAISLSFLIMINNDKYFLNLEEIKRGDDKIYNFTFCRDNANLNTTIIEDGLLIDEKEFNKKYKYLLLSITNFTFK